MVRTAAESRVLRSSGGALKPFTPQRRFLTDEEAVDVARQFRRDHPHRLRLIRTTLGWGDLRDDMAAREFVHCHPLVAFRPADPPA